MEYLTAKQTVGKLKQGRVTDISEAYFSQLVKIGAIPHHTVPGKKRKLYLYDEVKEALSRIQDPTRDAQRDAVKAKKIEIQHVQNTRENEKEKLSTEYESAMDLITLSVEQLEKKTGYKGDVLEEAKRDLEDTQFINMTLRDLAHEIKQLISLMPLEKEVMQLLTFEILKLSIKKMFSIDDFYGMIDGMDEVLDEEPPSKPMVIS